MLPHITVLYVSLQFNPPHLNGHNCSLRLHNEASPAKGCFLNSVGYVSERPCRLYSETAADAIGISAGLIVYVPSLSAQVH